MLATHIYIIRIKSHIEVIPCIFGRTAIFCYSQSYKKVPVRLVLEQSIQLTCEGGVATGQFFTTNMIIITMFLWLSENHHICQYK